jgi:Flp pilus assembly pilin Flp
MIKHRTRQFGQGMTEYIIIVALIAIAAIAVYTLFGKTVREQAAGMAQELSGQSASGAIGAAQTAAGEAQTEADKTKGLDAYQNK